MRTRASLAIVEEARAYVFRFACDDCIHWCGDACLHGYPTRLSRADLTVGGELAFCKEFELGASDGDFVPVGVR